MTIATMSPPAGQKARIDMEHTKGKWLVMGNQRNGHFDFVLPMADDKDFQANARLIAAAPALLALVRGYRTTYPLDDYADAADKIIAQVSGGGNNAS